MGHISAESDSSAASSSSPYLLSAPYFATKQRVGSLRSRLKKQHPILLSDSDPNPEFLVTSVEREEAAAAAAAATSSSPSPTLGNSGRMRTTAETHSDGALPPRQHPLHLSGQTMVRRGATPAVANVSPRSSCEEAMATDVRPASRWSVASEADSGPATRVFFRHASGGNMADKSNFSSRDDSRDEVGDKTTARGW